MFKDISIEEVQSNLVSMIHNDWAVVTTYDDNKINGMTVNWMQVGYLWRRPVATIYIRPQRHTFKTIQNSNRFSIAFFDEKYRDALNLLGSKSGRDMDKIKECNLTTSIVEDTPIINEASLVIICEKLYEEQFQKDKFLKDIQIYTEDDYHLAITSEIIKVLKK